MCVIFFVGTIKLWIAHGEHSQYDVEPFQICTSCESCSFNLMAAALLAALLSGTPGLIESFWDFGLLSDAFSHWHKLARIIRRYFSSELAFNSLGSNGGQRRSR